jgi:uncharacterized coiled-coil protein SlyX
VTVEQRLRALEEEVALLHAAAKELNEMIRDVATVVRDHLKGGSCDPR